MNSQTSKQTSKEQALLINIFKLAKSASSFTDEEISNIRRDKLAEDVYDSIIVNKKKIS